jgi:hypothetical protein
MQPQRPSTTAPQKRGHVPRSTRHNPTRHRLQKGFQEGTAADGRITFGLRRTNLRKAAIHWAQDFRHTSRNVTLGAVLEPEFRTLLKTARQRAVISKHNAEESDGLGKAADPGKLKRQKQWTAWSRGLRNFLSTIAGQDGAPLSLYHQRR